MKLLHKKNRKCHYTNRDETPKGLLGFRDWPVILIGIPLLSFVIPILFLNMNVSEATHCFIDQGLWAMVFTAVFWLGNRQIILFFRRLFPDQKDLTKRLVKQGIAILVYTLVASFGLAYLQLKGPMKAVEADTQSEALRVFLISFTSTIFIVAIYEAAYFFFQWKESIAETEKLKKERVNSELQALRSQVNPHFLFNSLNTLASIIPEDPKKSVEFVQKMSSVYRKILDLNEREVVTLQEELDTLDQYLFLVQTRFPENLQVLINISSDARDKYVVPMSLQNLVENAIKHNVISKRKPLVISIENTDDEVIVKNDLQRKITEEPSTQKGLLNIENRYRLTFGRSIVVEETEQTFGVRIPLEKIETK